MATRRTRTVRTHTYSTKAWAYKLSFWLVIIIGVTMAITAILNLIPGVNLNSVKGVIVSICTAIALVIPVIMSYQVARYEKTWMFILWIVCVILVIFGVIVVNI